MRLRRRWRFGLAGLLLILVLYAAHPVYLAALGRFLITSDPLQRADAVLVLSGDQARSERLLHAVQLWKAEYASKIVLSAKLAEWQSDEDYPAWRYAMKLKALPKRFLLVARHDVDSTKEEAQFLLPFVQKHGFKTVIVVTSNFHSRRAKKVFQEQWDGSGVRVLISPAPSYQYHPDDWWKHRADSRTFFFEFSKTLWYALRE
jgi:uncharacterized SAM-binding protein YcdF (DUF218 family)